MIDRASARMALTLTLLTTWACGETGAPDVGAGAGAWTLSPEPWLSIGVVEGEEAYQLHDVRDVTRLPDGRLAVAHQGTREVRIYDGDGRFLLSSGEDGDGPGQWRSIAAVRPLGNDTLLVVDHRLDRYGFVDPTTGAYLGAADEARLSSIRRNRWHRRGLLLEAPPEVADPTVLEAVATALDVRDRAAPTFVTLQPDGRVWVLGAPSAPEATLRLFDLAGTEHARLLLPDRFRPLSLDGTELLGVWRDSLDVQHVRAYRLEGPATWPGPAPTELPSLRDDATASTARTPDADLPALTAPFRNVAVAQEMEYAARNTYTADADALSEIRDLELPVNARLDLLDASPTGWMGRIVDTSTGAGCMLAYGAYPPTDGLRSGAFSCWDAP